MDRRQALTTIGATAVVGLSGCLSRIPGVGSDGDGAPSTIENKVSLVTHELIVTEQERGVFAYVSGEAINTTEETLPVVVIQSVFKNGSGDTLAANGDPITDISPRASFSFSVPFPVPNDDPQLAKDIEEYELTILDSAPSNVDVDVDGGGNQPTPPEPPEPTQ
jgi:hypothetical protein